MRRFTLSPGAPTSPTRPGSSRPPAARLWLYRVLAAVVFPALLLLGLEGALRVAGYGRSAKFLIPDTRPGYYRTNPEFVRLFMPGGFDLRPLNFRVAKNKPANTVRLVILGESAAQGVPEPAFAFGPQLRAQLRARYPDKNIEIINTGIVAINSHVVRQIARDLVDFSPDLYVVYLGNNEIVGPHGPGCAYLSDMPPLPVIRLSAFIRATRSGQLLGAVLSGLRPAGARPAAWGGMAMFAESAVRGDDPRLEKAFAYFENNLEDIVRVATAAGAKTLLCTVVSNLKDCAPLLSLHQSGLTGANLAAWEKSFTAGQFKWLLGESAAARADLTEALRLDPQYAATSFMLGSLAWQAGETEAARKHFLAAQHWDALRFRPDPPLNEITRRVARRHPSASLVDTAALLGSDPASTVPPAGRELLFEHVHLDWEGNFLLAQAMAQGAEAALFGSASPRPWLDSAGVATALARTPQARAGVLKKIATITQNPPFPNQLTYPGDMARFERELARAQADRSDPEILRQAWQAAEAALASDPDNPALAKVAEDIADDLGDAAAALSLARRGRELQPEYFRLAANEALKLSQAGRLAEAEKLLLLTAENCAPGELAVIAPALVDLFNRTRRFAEGRRTLDAFIARSPGDQALALWRGRLAGMAGDPAAAEQEFRAVLAAEPGQAGALEELVALLHTQGRAGDADRESLAAAEHQPANQANNLRAALAAETLGDEARAAKYFLAAERSGPVSAAIELRLARKLLGLGRADEALLHLAWARRLAQQEGNATVTDSITEFIGRFRSPQP